MTVQARLHSPIDMRCSTPASSLPILFVRFAVASFCSCFYPFEIPRGLNNGTFHVSTSPHLNIPQYTRNVHFRPVAKHVSAANATLPRRDAHDPRLIYSVIQLAIRLLS